MRGEGGNIGGIGDIFEHSKDAKYGEGGAYGEDDKYCECVVTEGDGGPRCHHTLPP